MAPVGSGWRQLAELMQERGVDTVAELGVEVAAEYGERLRVVPRRQLALDRGLGGRSRPPDLFQAMACLECR